MIHLIAIAHQLGIRLTLEDFQAVSDRTPFLADLKPSGRYAMEDIYKLGGMPSAYHPSPFLISLISIAEIIHYLMQKGLVNGNTLTITGRTLGENVEQWVAKHGALPANQDLLRPVENPLKASGHIRYAQGLQLPAQHTHRFLAF